MSQFDFGNLSSPLPGQVFIDDNLEPWRNALHSLHSGSSRPSYVTAGMMWINNTTNPWVLNVYTGSNDIALGTLNTSTFVFTPSGQGNYLPLAGGTLTGALQTIAGSTSAPGIGIGEAGTGLSRPSTGVLAFSLSASERARLTSTGLGVGVTPAEVLHINHASTPALRFDINSVNTGKVGAVSNQVYLLGESGIGVNLYASGSSRVAVTTSGYTKIATDGTSGGSAHLIRNGNASSQGDDILSIQGAGVDIVLVEAGNGAAAVAGANAIIKVGNNNTTSRSINASGTINANGTDYAEYMRKNANCGTVLKGQIVGVDSNGQLTQKYSESVAGFLIKSTNPSYVGGDDWFEETEVVLKPEQPVKPADFKILPPVAPVLIDMKEPIVPNDFNLIRPEKPVNKNKDKQTYEDILQDVQYLKELEEYHQFAKEYEILLISYQRELKIYLDSVEYNKHLVSIYQIESEIYESALNAYKESMIEHQNDLNKYQNDLNKYNEWQNALDVKIEQKRALVDRMAFAGRVPVNVYGAKPGDYIIPVEGKNDTIDAITLSREEIFKVENYKHYVASVGVIECLIEDDEKNLTRAYARVKTV